ncbi:16S rRNA (adenine(1518)-N(6)/adenine(1519)-N(6))-dimethyltransferase [Candidatus Fermentibacteria bacterium]|nr:16S rRNA (adenine(1518)-N(6)/adenine(1519)-N(6))-dimethyltransferase [Candidatus Fermentibacteria bacterium]
MTAAEVRGILSRIGVTPSRSLGQHFLLSEGAAERIASAARGRSTLEIGPGLGILTRHLAGHSGSVTAVEISAPLSAFLGSGILRPGINVVNADFLAADPSSLPGYPFDTVAGNLPYGISTAVLSAISGPRFSRVSRAVLMLQTEVAARASCLSGGKEYGRLSLMLWPEFTVARLLDAGPGDFYPQPAVSSRVIVLDRRPEPMVPSGMMVPFRRMVKVCFASRRKTILNNLAALKGRDEALRLLGRAGIEPGLRAEQVPPEGFARLASLETA